jgi:CDP-glycerol glycerophosphotransferase (TagB/SpsB family)
MRNQLTHVGSLLGTAVARPAQFLLYLLSGLIPRRKDLWVFGSWGGYRFADNAAAFFLSCHETGPDGVDMVWISRRRDIVEDLRGRGYDAAWIWSVRGVVRCLRAGVYIFDCFSKDINFWLSRNATKVNLWSGVPLKAFERDIDNPGSRYHRLFHGSAPVRLAYGAMMPWHVVRPDLIIATSEETAAITRRAFDVPHDAVVVTGFPRNDALLSESGHRRARSNCPPEVLAATDAGRTVFFYLPTFRDSAKPYLNIDWDHLETIMEQVDGVFLIKFHPMDATTFSHRSPRVIQLPQNIDVYHVLPFTTSLISDYSSVIFDYMLLNRPIVYYMPDLAEFRRSSRRLIFDPEEISVGPRPSNPEELFTVMCEIAGDPTAERGDTTQWAAAMARLHAFEDEHSSARVLDALQTVLAG